MSTFKTCFFGLLAVLVSACSAAGDGGVDAQYCEMAFAAPAEALDGAQAAAARWSAATGCDIRIEETGVPIVLVPQVYMFGEKKAGMTAMRDGEPEWIELTARYAAPRWSTPILMHELMHAFGVRDHFADGVGRETVYEGDQITSAVLVAVCAQLPCRDFIPEVD